MKKILMILFFGLILMGCEAESSDQNLQTFELPTWLNGDYDGVHTGELLKISSNKISFTVDNSTYEFFPNEIINQTNEENKYIITTSSDILIFNKTTLQTEINFHFNDLNLGWFRNQRIIE